MNRKTTEIETTAVAQAAKTDAPPAEPGRAADRAVLDELSGFEKSLDSKAAQAAKRPIEPCPDLLARTAGKQIVTDDNMGSEWLHFLGMY